MPYPFSPSQLKLLNDRCGHALALYRARRQKAAEAAEQVDQADELEGPEMRDIGSAAHVCLHQGALAEKQARTVTPAMEAVARVIAAKMPPERAWEGLRIAEELCSWLPFDPEAEYEHGVAFKIESGKWRKVEWKDPDATYRMVFDVLFTGNIEDPDFGTVKICRVTDYKTGWGASPKELDSIQMKSYAVAAWKLCPAADIIEIQIVACRMRATYSKRFVIAVEEDLAALWTMQREVEFHLNCAAVAADAARLGPGCAFCDFSGQCQAYKDCISNQIKLAERHPSCPTGSTQAIAQEYAVLSSWLDVLDAHLRKALDKEPVTIGDMSLGYHESEKREVIDAKLLVNLWMEAAGALPDVSEEPDAADKPAHRKWEQLKAKRAAVENDIAFFRGMVQSSKFGVTQAEAILKKLAPELGYPTQSACLTELGPKYFKTTTVPKFGWKKN